MPALQPLPNDIALKQQRVTALATLPLFWSLTQKKVVIAGASDAAVWKAELIAASGAEVHLYAPRAELSEALLDLLGRGPAHTGGRFIHHHEAWHDNIFADAALAIADCEEDHEAEAFFNAARAAGVPVNVIDKPAFCQFQFGSIVNRSPVVVAISTDGGAPILAQAIRRRIETLLPPAIKRWAMIAQAIRERVNAQLQPGAARRTFWERFVDRVFLDTPEEGVETRLVAELGRLAMPRPAIGRVTIVGAGPGDAELLTLKAVRALQAADVILYDERISNDVLELARREAKRILVSQPNLFASGRPMAENGARVAALAKAGKRVVRLQPGNPTATSASLEEAERLERLGIAVELVAGVDSDSRDAAVAAMAVRATDATPDRAHIASH